jgi:hypothetical protein
MICIFKGPTPGGLDAGDLAVAQQFCLDNAAAFQYGQSYQERQLGAYIDGVKQSGQVVRISTNLVKDNSDAVTLSDFPADMAFGNCMTVNSQVAVAGIAGLTALSWTVFPDASADAVNAAWETLRGYFEG